MYSIAYENQDIVIRFNKDSIDKRTLSGFLEYIELAEIKCIDDIHGNIYYVDNQIIESHLSDFKRYKSSNK